MRASERKSGERERIWVVTRNPKPSECIPVRQIDNPNHYRSRLGDLKVETVKNHRKQDDEEAFWDKFRGENDKRMRSYFFNNFPEGCNQDFLKSIFSAVGEVLDIFCPKKKDKRGKPFGFVRFSAKLEADKVLEKLNNIWIDSYKIRAYIPRFNRKETQVKKDPKQVVGRQSFLAQNSLRKPEKSYADMKAFSWETHGEEIQEEGGELVKTRYMGDGVILIENTSGKTFETLIQDLDEWFKQWFEWFRPWKEVDVSHKRLIWTRWIGVPAHAWTTRFFATVSLKLGSFIKLDANVNEVLKIRVNDDLFSIKVMEEFEGMKTKECGNVESEDDVDSLWSRELNGSNSKGPTEATEDGNSLCFSGGSSEFWPGNREDDLGIENTEENGIVEVVGETQELKEATCVWGNTANYERRDVDIQTHSDTHNDNGVRRDKHLLSNNENLGGKVIGPGSKYTGDDNEIIGPQ
ncbi:hypothetical protein ACS0TY_015369 [Phlomoides rotata]